MKRFYLLPSLPYESKKEPGSQHYPHSLHMHMQNHGKTHKNEKNCGKNLFLTNILP